jgi:membrane fusion protein (multidrug efflux system)
MNNEENQANQEQENENQNNNENSGQADNNKKGTIFGLTYKTIGIIVLAIIIVVGGYFGIKEYLYYHNHVSTNDAKTDGHINPVVARVSGFIDSVYVHDNEHVRKGQMLVQVDTTEYSLKVYMAVAALQSAKAALGVAKATVQTAKVKKHHAQTNFNRVKHLYKGGATTKSKFQDAQTSLASAKAALAKAKENVNSAKKKIQSQKENLKHAKLQLSYTHIKAGSEGMVSQKISEKASISRRANR